MTITNDTTTIERQMRELGLELDGLDADAVDLEVIERRVASERRALHERIDTLQAELVDRHKTGRASVDGLLS